MKDLLSVKRIAVPGALVQIAIATSLGVLLGWALDWSLGAGIILGLALSVASTVVLLRALEERRILATERGRIAMAWLVVEDLLMVLALVLIPVLTPPAEGTGTEVPRSVLLTVGIALLKMAGFVALMLVVGRRAIPWLLERIARVGSREVFTLAVLAIALGIAFGSAKLFGISFALGAFFAGMVLNGSRLSHDAAERSLPLRDAFAVLFFVSVGMLFDPKILVDKPLIVLAVCLIILVGKTLAAMAIVLLAGYGINTALTIAASLAQIGEFSFILVGLGVSLGILPPEGRDLVLAGAILSITLNPFVFNLLERFEPKLAALELTRWRRRCAADTPVCDRDAHVVLVGYGGVGRRIAEAVRDMGRTLIVVDHEPEHIAALEAAGIAAIYGNAAADGVLASARIEHASLLLVAIPDLFESGEVVRLARAANPSLEIVARAVAEEGTVHLESHGASSTVIAEHEIAQAMARHAQVSALGVPA